MPEYVDEINPYAVDKLSDLKRIIEANGDLHGNEPTIIMRLIVTVEGLKEKLDDMRTKLMNADVAAHWYKSGLEKILETEVYLVGSSNDNIAYKQIARYNLALGDLNGTQGMDLEEATIEAEKAKMVEVTRDERRR